MTTTIATPARYRQGERYSPSVGPHRYCDVRVVAVTDVGAGYDRVRVRCCGSWAFLHHWGRWAG